MQCVLQQDIKIHAVDMYHQYMNQAQAKIANLSSDELKELINDDEKLEEHVNEVVSGPER